MNESQGDHGTSENRRKGSGKRSEGGGSGGPVEATAEEGVAVPSASTAPSPCGACKFLRRKCMNGCIFSPDFGSDQGAARFAAVHKVFGASNVSKLLLNIPGNQRRDAVVTISYEAQARLNDPVFGCVSTILALQQQVASLQAELAMVQTQLMNNRFAVANALQGSQAIQQQHVAMLQPAYSNTSSSSNNLVNINSFNFNCGFELAGETAGSFDHIQLPPTTPQEEEEDEEEESQNPASFTNQIFH